jgi:hypothetical protein
MRLANYKKAILFVAAVTSLSACSNGQFQLPDDANTEQTFVDTPSTDNGSSAVTDPSEPAAPTPTTPTAPVTEPPVVSLTEEEMILKQYDNLDPQHIVPDKHLKAAVLYFDKNKAKIKNQNYMTVIDYSMKSTKKRFFLINMKTGAVVAYHVAHGKGSDADHDGYAESFSNASGSNATSLGYYLTAETYNGGNGYSLKLDGQSSTNSNARARAVVVHGASYVQESDVIQGRSWGCPALTTSVSTAVINQIKNGSLMYAAYK